MATRTFTAADKKAAVEREIKYRKRVYHRLVNDGKMKPELAAAQIHIFEEIAKDYEKLAAQDRLI